MVPSPRKALTCNLADVTQVTRRKLDNAGVRTQTLAVLSPQLIFVGDNGKALPKKEEPTADRKPDRCRAAGQRVWPGVIVRVFKKSHTKLLGVDGVERVSRKAVGHGETYRRVRFPHTDSLAEQRDYPLVMKRRRFIHGDHNRLKTTVDYWIL
jgi:hypothetical protein